MRIEVVHCPGPDEADRVELQLPAGATLLQALQASGLAARHPGLDWDRVRVGVHGRLAPLQRVLEDGDRVEVYRPLQVDPMQARRLRAQRQRDASGSRRSPRR